MAWTADHIRESGLAARVVLSTEDNAIADEGRNLGLEVPFVRPSWLAAESATNIDVTLHALDWFHDAHGADPEAVMLLQPTSPLRGGDCLRAAVDMLAARPEAGSVVAMTALHLPPSALFLADGRGFAQAVSEDRRRPVLVPNGALYLTRTAHLRAGRSLYAPPILPLILDPRRAVDIDTQADWDLAEALLAAGPPAEPSSAAAFAPPASTDGRAA